MTNRKFGGIVAISGFGLALLAAVVTWWFAFDSNLFHEIGILAILLACFPTIVIPAMIIAATDAILLGLMTPAERRALEVRERRIRLGLPPRP